MQLGCAQHFYTAITVGGDWVVFLGRRPICTLVEDHRYKLCAAATTIKSYECIQTCMITVIINISNAIEPHQSHLHNQVHKSSVVVTRDRSVRAHYQVAIDTGGQVHMLTWRTQQGLRNKITHNLLITFTT